MPYAIGSAVGVLTVLFLAIVRFDRDRAVYPTILVVVALYYVLFAVLGGGSALVQELVQLLVFSTVAVVGFSVSPWWTVAGLAGHGAFDLVHGRLILDPGVPAWWPAFCMSADVGLAGGFAWILLRRRGER